VAGRIKKFYRTNSIVIYPPVEFKYSSIPVFQSSSKLPKNLNTGKLEDSYYLMISRIVGGKGILEASQAFKKLGITLKIVGEVVDLSLGQQVETIGRVDDQELANLYEHAKGFVALSLDEDFGMTVVESMVYGTPVLAYNGGGYKETVVEGMTGVFINDLNVKSIKDGLERMEKTKWDKEYIKKWAKQFGRAHFEQRMREIIGE